jgi:hypothetical protein
LQIPVQAIYDHFGTTYCLIWNNGQWEAREVKIGSANDKFLVVQSGLSPNEEVVMNPRRWLSKVNLPEPPEPKFSPEEMIADGGAGTADGGNAASAAEDPAGAGAMKKLPPGVEGGPPPGVASGIGPGASPRGPGAGGPGADGPGAGGRGPGGGNPAQGVARNFANYDANQDGVLSSDEIPADRADRWKNADTDGNGAITRAEMTAFFNQRMAAGGPPGGGPIPRAGE